MRPTGSCSPRLLLLLLVMSAAFGLTAPAPAPAADGRPEYNRDVRPIFLDTCFACHGPDSAARKADLRLDQREAAMKTNAIVPGKPDDSEMIRRILSQDPNEVMPPPAIKKPLSDVQKQMLVRWVKEGAEYQLHWSFLPPKRAPLPPIKHDKWPINPIDRFVLARLEKSNLEPAPEADRRTLARRVSLDLTGLPPAPETVDAYVRDASADAYEKLVDGLLAKKEWGEHRGRYWLDYARYADTHGIHFDNFREMWTYRDWVINAFNRNMPFDEFTIENLAGDLLPNRTIDQQIGSGFNRCNMTTNEGGIIDEEYLVNYTRDRTETTSQVWLGLTTGCAVCHNHKFDPVSQREFYELAAFFNNTTQGARDGNIKDTPPILTVPPMGERSRWDGLKSEQHKLLAQRSSRRGASEVDFQKWLATANRAAVDSATPSEGLAFFAALDAPAGDALPVVVAGKPRTVALSKSARWKGGPAADSQGLAIQGTACTIPDVGDFEIEQPFTASLWLKLPANDGMGAVVARMNNDTDYRGWDVWVEGRRVGMHIIHKWPESALKVLGKDQLKANKWTHVAIAYDGSGKAAGLRIYYDGKLQAANVESDKLSGSIRTEVPFKIGQRHNGQPASAAVLSDLRIYQKSLDAGAIASLAGRAKLAAILVKTPPQRGAPEVDQLRTWWLETLDAPTLALNRQLDTVERGLAGILAQASIAYVMQEKNDPAAAFLLFRGQYDQRRDKVSADTPDVLPPFPAGQPRNRLGFARWLMLPDHPLTARVTVNRFWQEVFGTGLVRTTGDFGVSGETPSHPELLDWLAVDFRESGWDVKRLFKLMVTSAAYRQSAAATPAKLEADPQNRLLSRGPRFRMDAEMVRDYALAASGLLASKIGGPSVKPYQPPGVWEAIAMDVSNTRSYQPDKGEGLYRRSLYTFWKRMAPPASMDIFNAPNRELCTVRRERTNTPLQALVTLNDEQFIEAARHLARLAIRDGGVTVESRENYVGRRLLSRQFRPEEAAIVQASFDKLSAHYSAHPDEAAKLIAVGASKPDATLPPATLAAWTMLVNQLMNLDEVLNK